MRRHLNISQSLLRLLGAALSAFIYFEASGAEAPVVYGLVVGVTNYEGGSLPSKVIESAERFYTALTNAYPSANKRPLFDKDATAENVRHALYEEIPKLPPRSLVIVYFAGHGKRVDYDREEIPSDLFLLLNGGGLGDGFSRKAIRADDILTAISRTRLSSAMIFLDCCFSGNDARLLDIPEATLRTLGLRAFLLSSSSRAEPTLAGIFTRSLVKAWEEARSTGNDCLTPGELEARMKEIAKKESNDFMHPELSFGREITRCFAQLDHPSCLVCLEFTNGCRYPLQINMGVTTNDYTPGRKPFAFFRQVARHPISIEIIGPGRQLIWQTNLTSDTLNRDYLLLPIALPGELAVASTSDLAESKFLVAKAIESYGAEPAELYAASASLLKEANLDNSEALARVAKFGRQRLIPSLFAKEPTLPQLELAAESKDWPNAVQILEGVGRHATAAKIGEIRLLRFKTNPIGDEVGYPFYVAAKNYKAAGQTASFENLLTNLLTVPLHGKQRETIEILIRSPANSVRESIKAFPDNVETWKALGQLK